MHRREPALQPGPCGEEPAIHSFARLGACKGFLGLKRHHTRHSLEDGELRNDFTSSSRDPYANPRNWLTAGCAAGPSRVDEHARSLWKSGREIDFPANLHCFFMAPLVNFLLATLLVYPGGGHLRLMSILECNSKRRRSAAGRRKRAGIRAAVSQRTCL